MPYWTALEAAELMMNFAPGYLAERGTLAQKIEMKALATLMERDAEAGVLESAKGGKFSPHDIALWSLGRSHRLSDLMWKRLGRSSRNKRTPEETEEVAAAVEEAPLHPKTRNTLLRLVLGMAIQKYRFKPGVKNSAAKNISSDLEEAQIFVSDDTVFKWLSTAVNELDYELPPHKR